MELNSFANRSYDCALSICVSISALFIHCESNKIFEESIISRVFYSNFMNENIVRFFGVQKLYTTR